MSALSRIVGIGCLLGALYAGQRSLEFRRHGEVVDGKVVAVDAKVSASRDGVDYSERTEIRYTPRSGGPPLLLKSNWNGALFGSNDVGDTVAVRYLPARPDDAREDSALRDWLLPLLLVVLGVAGLRGRLRSDDSGPEFTLWRDRRE